MERASENRFCKGYNDKLISSRKSFSKRKDKESVFFAANNRKVCSKLG
jgi:hypothetical protein